MARNMDIILHHDAINKRAIKAGIRAAQRHYTAVGRLIACLLRTPSEKGS
jgi:hypothetical protein